MEVEKRSSKGGILQFFDWNRKSRKKLFSNKSELPDNGKHGKEYVDGLAISRIQDVHENGRVHESKVITDLHPQAAPWANAEYGYEGKAPGVVARLMGLDSLPSSNASDHSTLTSESRPFNDSDYIRSLNFHDEHHIVIYESTRNKANRIPNSPLKMQRPVEKFQAEVLPSRTSKPVSIPHNKLKSPIKSPGFIPPRNAAFVMEEAARIIEQSPRSTAKGKSSSLVSSSATLRFHDLNDKMGTARKQYPPPKHVNLTSKTSTIARQSVKTKEKSAPPAVKAKSTVQRREGMTSFSRTSGNNQPNSRRNVEKKISSSRSSEVLRQNNQKQNYMTSKDEESSRPSTSNRMDRKVSPTSDITRKTKVVNKVIISPTARSGETNSMVGDSSGFRIKKIPKKKVPDNGSIHSVKSTANSTGEKSVSSRERNDFDVMDRKNGLDVVSFTFTSPIKKSFSGSSSSTQRTENKGNSSLISSENDSSSIFSGVSCSGINQVGGDALSVLLDQKLKELSSIVEDPLHNQAKEMTSISSGQFNSCTSKDWQGSKWSSSFENEEVSDQSSTSVSQISDGDLDLTDSACSASATDNSKGPYHWELEYIKSIINNADLMLEEFALGHVHRVMDPNLFDHLESHITESNKNLEEQFRVARRALFDCVEECLQSRCRRNFCGSFRAWSKWIVVFQSCDHVAEDLYREIFSLTSMVDLMVDEVVDKDMSNQDGRWVEFECETFEEGIEIENEILSSLVDELLGDIFVRLQSPLTTSFT